MATNRILIVDDDPGLRMTLHDILKANGYAPTAVATGKDALAAVEEELPAVALIDLKLEDMSGLKVMREIKARSPDTECIVLTGYASQSVAIEAVNLGAYGFVQKPYDVDLLLVTIRRAIEKRETEEALRESEERYRDLVEHSRDLICTHDLEGRVLSANPAAAKAIGYDLNETALDMSTVGDVHALLQTIARQSVALLQARGAGIYLYDQAANELEFAVAYGAGEEYIGARLKPGEGLSGKVMQDWQPMVVDDYQAWEGRSPQFDAQPFTAVAAVPLLWQDQLIGVLNVVDDKERRTFGDDDVRRYLKAVACVPLVAQEQTIGALWMGRNTPIGEEEVHLLTAIADMAGNAIQRASLHEQTARQAQELAEALSELEDTYRATLTALTAALDARDRETEGHSRRVTELSLAVARAMGLRDQELATLERGAILHDVGKIGVSDAILRKPGRLTPEEWGEMKKHPEMGYQILKDVRFLNGSLPLIRHHHERWDGRGYPMGLAGEAIPLGARIFAVADAYDAMTSDRHYRAAMSHEEAIAELKRCAGTQFDPAVVEAVSRIFDFRLPIADC